MQNLTDYVSNNNKRVTKVGVDLIAIIILAIPVLVLYFVGKPFNRGFNCDDESIRYPYKENTISSGVNYLYSTSIPVITIIIIEFVYHSQSVTDYKKGRTDSIRLSTNTKPSVYGLIWIIYCRLSPFVFGALISQMTTDIAKYSIGRLRPHFINVCQPQLPNGMIITLENPSVCQELGSEYLTQFDCFNPDFTDHRKKDARLSFMSGHSSFAAYCLVYLVIYLQIRLKWSALGFVRPLYQALLLYLVIYTGFSRISDYKHHWSDVLTGLIQGTIVAILTTYFISDLFRKTKSNDSIEQMRIQASPQTNYDSCRVELDGSITGSEK